MTLLPLVVGAGALTLAHHYLSKLLMLTFLDDIEKFIRSLKGMAKMVLMVAKGIIALALPKSPVVVQHAHED